MDGAPLDDDGYFTCADLVPLQQSPDGTYNFETAASDAVDEAYDGDVLRVRYIVSCLSDLCVMTPPSPPPPSP